MTVTQTELKQTEWRRDHYRRLAAAKLARLLVSAGQAAGLSDDEIIETATDPNVQRQAETALHMKVRSGHTWALVVLMIPGALRRASQ